MNWLINLIRFIYTTEVIRKNRKKIKPIVMLIPENTDDIYIDVKALQRFRKEHISGEAIFGGWILDEVFGKNIFVFDVSSCEFIK